MKRVNELPEFSFMNSKDTKQYLNDIHFFTDLCHNQKEYTVYLITKDLLLYYRLLTITTQTHA